SRVRGSQSHPTNTISASVPVHRRRAAVKINAQIAMTPCSEKMRSAHVKAHDCLAHRGACAACSWNGKSGRCCHVDGPCVDKSIHEYEAAHFYWKSRFAFDLGLFLR